MSAHRHECDCNARPGRPHAASCNALKPAEERNPAVEIEQAHATALALDHTPKHVTSLNNVRNLGDGQIHMRASNGQNQITACHKPIYNVRGWISNEHVTCPQCVERRRWDHDAALQQEATRLRVPHACCSREFYQRAAARGLM